MIADHQDLTDNVNHLVSLYPTRMLAIQSMYSIDIIKGKKEFAEVASDYVSYHLEKYPVRSLDQKFYFNLLEAIWKNLAKIDGKIATHIDNAWKIERLPKLVLAILRVGSYDVSTTDTTQVALVINDYLQISKSLGHAEEIGFINGILDKMITSSSGVSKS
ncbi:transcription antitermination factor NusB [Candidatus Bandiella euplotis]|uniref:Transcription antitermination factor NusB n=1 Tax=Candidatus Bandiella euplotis TaxID=1664265 RepID=A0ABZ0UM59_9RICK|nr:transcription antitermination factor NusB [Candidatus Bandiella woodruffii]WPX97224.1 Transcription antitermination factor NusB [Candidatus Bandiella woodruffii]